MGGFASGLAKAGFEVSWANDSNQHACNTFRHRFRHANVIEKDVQELSVSDDSLESVDVIAAGFPCQSFSQAGDRKGFEDPRGVLFLEIPRLLKEFALRSKPRLLMLENVPHLLHGADGRWFTRIRHSLLQAGYWFRRQSCWTVNVHHVTDLPQDRLRLFMVAASRHHYAYNPFHAVPPATLNGRNAQESKDRPTIHDFIDRTQRRDTREYLPSHNKYYKMIDEAMVNGDSQSNIYQLRRSYVREKKNGLCPTLTANMGLGGHNVPFIRDRWGIRRLGLDEVAHLQGFDDVANLFPADTPSAEKYRLLGNAVCVKLAANLASQCLQILTEE